MNKADRLRYEKLVELGCILADKWGHECEGKVDCHHPIGIEWRGMSQKAPNDCTIPLCHLGHHQFGRNAIHQIGKRPWEKKYGSQKDLLTLTNELISK